MSYWLEALIGKTEVIGNVGSSMARARVVYLNYGYSMIPLTDMLKAGVEDRYQQKERRLFSMFYKLSDSVAVWIDENSVSGALAYVEVDIWDDERWDQRSIVSKERKIVLGPLYSEGAGAVNEALRFLGVRGSWVGLDGSSFGSPDPTEGWGPSH